MDISILGIVLGLTTAVAWSIASVVHTEAVRQIGIPNVLLIRQPLACIVLSACIPLYGFPEIQSMDVVYYAILSGIFGIVLGDVFFYYAALRIGLTIVEAIQSFSACITVVLGYMLLGESISLRSGMGILLISFSVLLVIVSEGKRDVIGSRRDFFIGVAAALAVTICTALSIVFSKKALVGIDTFSLTLFRNVVATVAVFSFVRLSGRSTNVLRVLNENRQTIKLFAIGCLCGPAGGIWISCVAIDLLPTAIASSLFGLQPVFLLCIVSVLKKRRPRPVSLLGVLLASYGVYLCV